MESLDIQSYTYQQRKDLLPNLSAAFCNCGGWVLDRRALSSSNMVFHVELQLRAVLDLYAALISSGVELTRSGHKSFTELCTRRQHLRIATELGQIVAIRLEIAFLDELALRSTHRSRVGFS